VNGAKVAAVVGIAAIAGIGLMALVSGTRRESENTKKDEIQEKKYYI
jgi:hypothetical protein